MLTQFFYDKRSLQKFASSFATKLLFIDFFFYLYLLANTHYQESKFNGNFHNARMDWAGFARSVRQTFDSVMFYVIVNAIFSLLLLETYFI